MTLLPARFEHKEEKVSSAYNKIALVSGLGAEWGWEDKLHIALNEIAIRFQHVAVPVDHDCLIFPGESKQEFIRKYCTGSRTVILFARKAMAEDFPGAIVVRQDDVAEPERLRAKLCQILFAEKAEAQVA